MNTKYLISYLNSYFAADRACAVVRWLLVLSAMILLFAAVGTIPSVMAEY